VSKIIPVLKKWDKSKIKNYQPISNLCSSSKIFVKLIMKRTEEIQKSQDVDLTGSAQYGFKKLRSTATAGLTNQSILARGLHNQQISNDVKLELECNI
jgi:hypothetical protein